MMQECIDECDESENAFGTMFPQCLIAADDDYEQYVNGIVPRVESMKDFAECCDAGGGCKSFWNDLFDCLRECLPECVADGPLEWLDCVNDEIFDNGESNSCGYGACASDVIGGVEGLADFVGDEDNFEPLAIQGVVCGIATGQLEQCDLLEDFIEDVCEVAECCTPCEEEWTFIVDCLLNEVTIPLASMFLNFTFSTCPLDDKDCKLDRRRYLEVGQLDNYREKLNKDMTMISDESRERFIQNSKQRVLEGHIKNVSECETGLLINLAVGNATNGMTNYLDCTVNAMADTIGSASAAHNASVQNTSAGYAAQIGIAIVATFASLAYML